MRLFARLFICAAALISAAVLLSGYLMIAYSYESTMERETERALDQYQYSKFAVQAAMISNEETWRGGITPGDAALSELADEISGRVVFLAGDKSVLYTDFRDEAAVSAADGVEDGELVYEFAEINGRRYLIICSKLTQSGIPLYLLVANDVSRVIAAKDEMLRNFRFEYIITIAVSMVFILILSTFITSPIKRLTNAAGRMAGGDLSGRLPASRTDEIGDLSASFNAMADSVEDKMNELVRSARQRENFIASFSHELKTPLTSVIGYADMLYQKDLPPERVKGAAWYILNESLRLESLSLKLMDLIILGKQDFVLETVKADELLRDVTEGLMPLLNEKKVAVRLDADEAGIDIEYDLFKTLLINLIDNAVKADSAHIWITGEADAGKYRITVKDDGRGMPVSELDRITEAFYTVDKSRSRKQHGAGLGLTLAAKIAEIHGSRLEFTSEPQKGTAAAIVLECRGSEGGGGL